MAYIDSRNFWADRESLHWQNKERDAQETIIRADYERWKETTDMRPESDSNFDVSVKGGQSLMDDINDRIDHEFYSPAVEITAQPSERKRFNTIPEDE